MPDIRLQEYATEIQELLLDERPDEVIAHCRHILLLYPKYIQAYRLLGDACLARGMYQRAREFFQRALSADPENLAAWVGLGRVYDEQGMLREAVWPMERAFELAPGNAEVQRELERLYNRRVGPQYGKPEGARLKLTRAALGRLYMRSGLHELAIVEFRTVLDRCPDLPDIRVALIEALWKEGHHLRALEACLELLEVLPNCLKANLILGAIRLKSGHEDAGQARLDVVRALDPENLVAQEVMGVESPLPPKDVLIPILEADGVPPLAGASTVQRNARAEGIPDWVRELALLESEDGPSPAKAGPDEPSQGAREED